MFNFGNNGTWPLFLKYIFVTKTLNALKKEIILLNYIIELKVQTKLYILDQWRMNGEQLSLVILLKLRC